MMYSKYKCPVAGLCLLAMFSLMGCGESVEPIEDPIARVKVFEVATKATGQSRRISGKVESPDRSTLSFGVAGRIEEVFCKVGQQVIQGEILAQLDDEPLKIYLENARANLSSARANHLDAKTTLARVEELFAHGVSPQAELDQARVGSAQSESSLQSAKGALAQSELDYARTKLVAPYSGLIASIDVNDFQEVGASTTVFVLQSDQSLEVQVRVPESFIRDVDYGQIVEIAFPSLDDVTLSGSVTTIGAESEGGNAFPVTILLAATDADIRAGMTASVTFLFDAYLQDQIAYLIPLSSIAVEQGLTTERPGGDEGLQSKLAPIFVLNPQTQTVELRKVKVGDLRGNTIEVFDGLQQGDLVVTAGVAFLRDGMPAIAWNPSTGASDE